MTPGEIVLPEALQTRGVLDAIRQAAMDASIPLKQLRVGSDFNSINPQTGQPEFYYSGDEQPARTRNPSEQQVADLYITHFPNAALWQGHVGIGVNTDQTEGFYPDKNALNAYSIGMPGLIKKDDLSQPHETLRIPTTPEQDAAVQEYINQRRRNPGYYDLYSRQCTDFVGGALRTGGVELPSDSTQNSYDNIVPNRFFPLLRDRYRK